MRFDRRFAMVLAVSLVWASLVTAFFARMRGSAKTRAAGPEKSLVIAARALPLGSVLTRDAIKLRSVPESLFPNGGFAQIEDVVDRPVISGIQADEPVLEARIAARGSGVGLAPLIPAGMRAISVRVNDVVGVAGFVLPGMRVDVLVTGRPTNHPDSVARTVLQNIAVLSAGQTIQSEGKNAINTPVVTLLVTPEDAESLTLANSDGHIQLVLRNSADAGLGSTRGRQWSDLYATRAPEAPATSPAAAPREPRTVRRAPARDPAPEITPAPMPAAVDQVVVIRGNVKTVEPAVNGGGK